MPWQKPSAQLSALLAEAVTGLACVLRPSFGCPAWYTEGGNLFCGVFEDNIFLRLSDSGREEFLRAFPEASAFDPMKGRSLKEYVVLPEEVLADPKKLSSWILRSFEYAAALPVKKKKK